MKLKWFWVLAGLTAVFLAGCQSANEAAPASNTLPTVPDVETTAGPDGETVVDDQGAVSVGVTPLNLSHHDETLDFEIAMNTHSVDLSMNLAELATLQTDTGVVVPALAWNAPMSGGHHVSGLLQFPANPDGRHLLDNAHTITLRIQNVDAPERVFTWQLTQ